MFGNIVHVCAFDHYHDYFAARPNIACIQSVFYLLQGNLNNRHVKHELLNRRPVTMEMKVSQDT